MKQTIIIFFCVLFFTSCQEQVKTNSKSEAIKGQLGKMAEHLVKNDFRSFSEYTYPEIIEMMGGKDKMIEIMEKGLIEMQSEGIEFSNITFGEPSEIITVGEELQATITQKTTMKVPNGSLIAESTLIAISLDQGKKWYFIDTSGRDIQTIKKLLPNLSEKLIIQEKKQPVFHPN